MYTIADSCKKLMIHRKSSAFCFITRRVIDILCYQTAPREGLE